MKRLIFIILSLVLLSGYTQAGDVEWKLDPAHTNFYFDIQHIYSTIRGNFSAFSGEIDFDPDSAATSKLNIEIKADSINTNNEKRDNHLRTKDFFDTGAYPVMKFQSTSVAHAGGDKYVFTGKMTIKDVTRDMALEFIYHGQKENPLKPGELVAGMDCSFTLNRLDFHVGDGKFYKMGVVDKDVKILISVEMVRKK